MTDEATERRQVDDGSDNALQLQEISTSLIREGNLDALYGRILDAAISLLSADMGSIQVLCPERGELRLLVCRGFHPVSAAFWEWVRLDSASSCGLALSAGARIVVPDVRLVTLWLVRATSTRLVGQAFERCSPRRLSRGPANCWA